MKHLIDLIMQQIEADSLWPAEYIATSLLRELRERWPQINDTTKGEIVPFRAGSPRGIVIPIGEDRFTLVWTGVGARWLLDEDFGVLCLRAAYCPQNDTLYVLERRKVSQS